MERGSSSSLIKTNLRSEEGETSENDKNELNVLSEVKRPNSRWVDYGSFRQLVCKPILGSN